MPSSNDTNFNRQLQRGQSDRSDQGSTSQRPGPTVDQYRRRAGMFTLGGGRPETGEASRSSDPLLNAEKARYRRTREKRALNDEYLSSSDDEEAQDPYFSERTPQERKFLGSVAAELREPDSTLRFHQNVTEDALERANTRERDLNMLAATHPERRAELDAVIRAERGMPLSVARQWTVYNMREDINTANAGIDKQVEQLKVLWKESQDKQEQKRQE